MKKYLILGFILLLVQQMSIGATRTVSTYHNIPNQNYYYNNPYNRDLIAVEDYLFGNNYRNDNLTSRLNRIERKLFNRLYTDMSYADRVNNILANYRDDYYYNNYLSGNGKKTVAQKFIDRFVGQPTGYTPPIVNMPFNDYGYPMGINRGTYSNRGYKYNNWIPATTGAGIHILD